MARDASRRVETQLAEAFAKIPGRGLGWKPAPAGSCPSGKVNPKTIESLREVGYDLASIVLNDYSRFLITNMTCDHNGLRGPVPLLLSEMMLCATSMIRFRAAIPNKLMKPIIGVTERMPPSFGCQIVIDWLSLSLIVFK